jgi:hypothetical protein
MKHRDHPRSCRIAEPGGRNGSSLTLEPGDAEVDPRSIEAMIARLHRSGWRLRVTDVTDTAGRQGEREFRVEGATPDDA